MRRRMANAVCLILALGGATAAAGQETARERASRWFLEHDRNHDGYLTFDEVVGYELKRLKRMDPSGSGTISVAAYCAGIVPAQPDDVPRCQRQFAKIDANGDGSITPEEVTAFYHLVIQTADLNGDGKVSLQEWIATTAGS